MYCPKLLRGCKSVIYGTYPSNDSKLIYAKERTPLLGVLSTVARLVCMWSWCGVLCGVLCGVCCVWCGGWRATSSLFCFGWWDQSSSAGDTDLAVVDCGQHGTPQDETNTFIRRGRGDERNRRDNDAAEATASRSVARTLRITQTSSQLWRAHGGN